MTQLELLGPESEGVRENVLKFAPRLRMLYDRNSQLVGRLFGPLRSLPIVMNDEEAAHLIELEILRRTVSGYAWTSGFTRVVIVSFVKKMHAPSDAELSAALTKVGLTILVSVPLNVREVPPTVREWAE